MEVTVLFVLANRILGILLCELVFQLHRDYRKPIDKQTNIQSQLSSILRISQLSYGAEDILFVHDSCLLVILRRCQIKHDEICRVYLHAITKHINNATFSNLTGEPVQKLTLLCIRLKHAQLVHFLRLRIFKESEQACLIDCILFVVVGIGSFFVAVLLNKPLHD